MAADWHESKQPRAGDRFLAALDDALALIEESPLRFPELETIEHNELGLRRVLLQKFPYLVIYQSVGEDIRVIAIPHVGRRPDYWMDRLT
jgi:plasmid stabilization system protein ParE